jgi:signal transduction histidine kinase
MKLDVLKVVKRSRLLFPLACIAALALLLVSEAAYWRSVRSMDELAEAARARASLQSLAQSILDAESGQRGYLLTDRREYLLPYQAAQTAIGESFKFLDVYYADNPQEAQALKSLHQLSDAKLAELAGAIRLHDAGKTGGAIELVLSDIGKEKMEAMRVLVARLQERERRAYQQSRGEIDRTQVLSRFGVAALSALSLLVLVLYLRQTTALERQQQEQGEVLRAERDRLQREAVLRSAQLSELTRHLLSAREDERNRLARELHDELGALLTSAKLDAARIKSRLANSAPEALERLASLVATLNKGIALKRQITEDLRPSALSNLGLVATLEILVREFAERSGIAVHDTLEPVVLPPDAQLMVYRLVQEALTNIAKYARAANVWISLGVQDAQVVVSVRDDGVGFDTTVPPTSAFGLVGMRFRVEAAGGTLSVTSAPGQGSSIQARLPQPKLATPGA